MLQLPVSCCVSLIMVTITRHIFINIFQMERFKAVKFALSYEKYMRFLVIPKSIKFLKSSKDRTGILEAVTDKISFFTTLHQTLNIHKKSWTNCFYPIKFMAGTCKVYTFCQLWAVKVFDSGASDPESILR